MDKKTTKLILKWTSDFYSEALLVTSIAADGVYSQTLVLRMDPGVSAVGASRLLDIVLGLRFVHGPVLDF